jgi:hypothetical protein
MLLLFIYLQLYIPTTRQIVLTAWSPPSLQWQPNFNRSSLRRTSFYRSSTRGGGGGGLSVVPQKARAPPPPAKTLDQHTDGPNAEPYEIIPSAPAPVLALYSLDKIFPFHLTAQCFVNCPTSRPFVCMVLRDCLETDVVHYSRMTFIDVFHPLSKCRVEIL